MKQAQQKLEICQRELTQWSSKKFGRLEATLQAKKKLLAVLQKNENLTNLAKIKKKKVQEEIELLLEQEDRRWKQRAKQHWYA